MKTKWISSFIIIFLISLLSSHLTAGGEWYKVYEDGLEAMENGDYKKASELFIEAIQGNADDDDNVRTYGMHSIEYFPHRELGICLYLMGDMNGARQELQISMKMEPSERAQEYLNQIGAGLPPEKKAESKKDVPVTVIAARVRSLFWPGWSPIGGDDCAQAWCGRCLGFGCLAVWLGNGPLALVGGTSLTAIGGYNSLPVGHLV